jgi:translocation and assembly module TamB
MLRWLKIAAAAAGALVLVLLVAVAGAFAWLQTGAGRGWVEARVAAATQGQVRLEQLEGAMPFDARAGRLVLADAQGPWLTAHGVRLVIDPWPLLRLHARIEVVSAERVEIARRPEGDGTAEPEAKSEPPQLPLSVEIVRLQVPQIDLARPVAGEPAQLSLSGSGALAEGAAKLQVALRRLDAPGDAAVDLAYDGRQLALDATLDDPGGLLAQAVEAPTAVPATLRARGTGPIAAWRGAVEARLGDAASRLDIAIDAGRLSATGSLDPRPLLQPRIAALLPEPLRLESAARIDQPRSLERIALASGPNRLSFEGSLGLEDLTGSGVARLAIPDLALLQPLLDVPIVGAISGTADLDTSPEGQTAKLALRGEGLALQGYSAALATLDATATRARGADAFDLAATLATSGLAAEQSQGRAALPADLALAFEGSIAPDAGRIDARRLSLTGEGAEIGFTGMVMRDGLLDGTLRLSMPQLAPFAQLAGQAWSGAVALEAKLASAPGSGLTRFTLAGQWRDPVTGIAALDPALGPEVTLDASGSARYDGALDLEQARIGAQALALTLAGRLAAQGPLDARFELTASDLARIGAGSGQRLSGAARLEGNVTGTAAEPRLSLAGRSDAMSVAGTQLADLALSATLDHLRTAPEGRLDGKVAVEGVRMELGSAVALKDELLSFSDLRARANGSTLAGTVAVALDGGTVTGALSLDTPDLAPWSRLAGLPLGGSARARLDLKADGSAAAEATGSSLAIANTRVGALRATAALPKWRGQLAGRIDIAADSVTAGAVAVDRATLRLDPKGGTFPLRFASSGTAAAPFSLEAAGAYDPAKRQLGLTALTGTYAQKPVRLAKGTSLAFANGLTVAPFALSWGEAQMEGELALGARLSGTVRVTRLPVEEVGAFAGRRDVHGTIRATLELSGTRAEPRARLDAAVAGLALSGIAENSPAGDLALQGDLGRERLDFRATLSSREADLSVTASGALPVAWSRPPFGVAIAPSGPLRAEVKGSGEIAPLFAIAGIGEDRASGRYRIDLAFGGALAAPSISGSARIENGYYQNFASGAELRDIRLEASGAHDRLQLTLGATDGGGGRIEGGGNLNFAGASVAAMDLTARLADFRAIRRDDVQARATGDLALAGPLDEMVLSGRVRFDRMSIALPERTRATAAVIDVIEVNAPEATGPRVARTDERVAGAPAAFKIGLDIAAELPRVEVTGRGLRSEWNGALAVGGTTVAPQITGELRLDRGTIAALGKTFTLTEGLIAFGGGPELDPSVRIIAEKEIRDAVARATLTGSLSSPLLEFSARPELPVDEVLARLLFDKGAGQVGAAEALQLAQVAAALQGGGASTGVIEKLGQKLGLDRIDISTVETTDAETGETGEAAALSLGKDISEDVRVGVEQGMEPGTGSVTVEVDLGKNLSVESRVGAQGRSGVGLKWEYDY